MTTSTTPEQIKAIRKALDKVCVRPFDYKSSDPKYNAQRNLEGRTYYVDDDTLRFHHSRILSAHHFFDGLLFHIVESCSLDMNNTKRGFRAVVFDVFGTTISRPKLEECYSSSKAAWKALEKEAIDLLDHYKTALSDGQRHKQESSKQYAEALKGLQ